MINVANFPFIAKYYSLIRFIPFIPFIPFRPLTNHLNGNKWQQPMESWTPMVLAEKWA